MTDPLLAGFDDFVRRSVGRPGQSRHVDATGIRLHYLEWPGPPGAPALLLLHGFLAHAHWWDFVAPWLAEDFRVIAPDFGGMGDSGHRTSYRDADFFGEIAAIIQHTGLAGCTAVGHSFGGRAMLHACVQHPALIARGIVVDSRLPAPDDPMRGFDQPWRAKRRYDSEAAILARFVLQPEEPAPVAALAHLARQSVRQDGDAWVWKFDDQVTRMFSERTGPVPDEHLLLAGIRQPIDVIRGELSRVVTPARAARMVGALPRARGPVVVPAGYHHLSVGQPIALVAALRSLLRSS